MKYKTFGDDAEVLGQAMLAFVQSVNFDEFQKILEQHNLNKIDPEKWYHQQIWLDVFNDIDQKKGASSNLVSIGMKVIETMATPPEFDNMPFLDQLRAFGGAYQANNRGKGIGEIQTEVLSDTHVIMHDGTPYPDDFVYGAYYAMARRFLPEGTQFSVYFDETAPKRKDGAKESLVHIKWT